MSFRCPECRESDTLYEDVEVPGWRSVDANLKPTHDRDVEWHSAQACGQYGCSCGWGPKRKEYLEELGIDGEPLPSVHRDQLEIVAAPTGRSAASPEVAPSCEPAKRGRAA